MTSEQSFQRSDLIGTQVITRDAGKRLGVVSQLWVDIDRREVVAFGLQDSALTGVVSNIEQTMLMRDVQQIGDVILVENDAVLDDDVDLTPFSPLINCEVITETGELLGKVRGFRVDSDGKILTLLIASLGLPRIPDQLISTYDLSTDEIVSTSPDRIIVFEGAEQKLSQVTVGILERLGIGNPPWDRGDMGYKTMPVNTTNQLGTGAPATPPPVVAETTAAATQEAWDEDNWEESQPQPVAEAVPQRQPEMVYAEEDNWGDTPQVQEAAYIEEVPYEEYGAAQPDSPYEDYDVSGDAWADDENPKPYRAQKLNIPEKKKVVEYEEEETDY